MYIGQYMILIQETNYSYAPVDEILYYFRSYLHFEIETYSEVSIIYEIIFKSKYGETWSFLWKVQIYAENSIEVCFEI